MSDHHHVSTRNILSFAQLEELFAASGKEGKSVRGDIVGKRYFDILGELTSIVEHQWHTGMQQGLIKGFLLCGPPGTGKTTLAKRLAYELGMRRRRTGKTAPVLVLVDGGEIARSRYGESEERIRDIFAHARAGFTMPEQNSVLLFDDVESIFMARGSQHVKEWHFSQDSVFFHSVDDLDASRSALVLTTNRPELVDEAIRDRFITYHIDYPDRETLIAVAGRIADLQHFPPQLRLRISDRLEPLIADGTVRSLRDVQRFVVQQYLESVLGRASLGQITSAIT
jgi:SpoVK/Ycf46/Vps4 family AAA+-type ATPase